MKHVIRAALLLLAASVAGIVAGRSLGRHRPDPPPSRSTSQHTGPSIEQVRLLSALVTSQVQIADVQITAIHGRTGSAEAVLIVKGEFLLSVDLEKARFESTDEQNRTAVLVLPPPQLLSLRVDHQRTRLFALQESGLWRIAPGDQAKVAVLEEAFREAEAMLRSASTDPQLLARSRQQAEAVLRAFMSAVGWEVRIRWADS